MLLSPKRTQSPDMLSLVQRVWEGITSLTLLNEDIQSYNRATSDPQPVRQMHTHASPHCSWKKSQPHRPHAANKHVCISHLIVAVPHATTHIAIREQQQQPKRICAH